MSGKDTVGCGGSGRRFELRQKLTIPLAIHRDTIEIEDGHYLLQLVI